MNTLPMAQMQNEKILRHDPFVYSIPTFTLRRLSMKSVVLSARFEGERVSRQ